MGIKNYNFLELFKHIDRNKEISLYRLVEKLTYDFLDDVDSVVLNICEENINNPINVVNKLRKYINEKNKKEIINNILKRKTIKRSMIEDYVVNNNKDKNYLENLTINMILKRFPLKNIIVKNETITNIIF